MAFDIRLQSFGSGFNIALSEPAPATPVEYAGRGVVAPLHSFATKVWQSRAKARAAFIASPLLVLPVLSSPTPQPPSPRGVVRSLVPVEQFRKTFDSTARVIKRTRTTPPARNASGAIIVLASVAGTSTALGQASAITQVLVNTTGASQNIPSSSGATSVLPITSGTTEVIGSSSGVTTLLANLSGASQSISQASANSSVPINVSGTTVSIASSSGSLTGLVSVSGSIAQPQEPLYSGRIVRPVPSRGPDYKRLFSSYKYHAIVPSVGTVSLSNAVGSSVVVANITATTQGVSSVSATVTVPIVTSGTVQSIASSTSSVTIPVNTTGTMALQGSTTAITTVPVNVSGSVSVVAPAGFSGFGVIRPFTKTLSGFYNEFDQYYYGARFALSRAVRVSQASATLSVPITLSGAIEVQTTPVGRSVNGIIKPLVPLFDFIRIQEVSKAQITVPVLAPAPEVARSASGTVSVLENVTGSVVTNPPSSGVIITPLVSYRTFVNNKVKVWSGRGATIVVAGDYPAPTRNASGSFNVLANVSGSALVTNGPIASASVSVPVDVTGTVAVVPTPEFTAFGISQPLVKDLGKYKRSIDEYKVRQVTPPNRPAPRSATGAVTVTPNVTGATTVRGSSSVLVTVAPNVVATTEVRSTTSGSATALVNVTATAVSTPLSSASGGVSVAPNVSATAVGRPSGTGIVSVLPQVTALVSSPVTASASVIVRSNVTATAELLGQANVPNVTVTPSITGQITPVGTPVSGSVSLVTNVTASVTSRMVASAVASITPTVSATASVRNNASATAAVIITGAGTTAATVTASGSFDVRTNSTGSVTQIPVGAQGLVNFIVTTTGEVVLPPATAQASVSIIAQTDGSVTSRIEIGSAILSVLANSNARATSFRLNPSGTRTITPDEAERIVFVGEEKRTIATQIENRKVIADASSRTIG